MKSLPRGVKMVRGRKKSPQKPGDPCPKCGTSLVDVDPKYSRENERGIWRLLRCPTDEKHYNRGAFESKPHPDRNLIPGDYPIGLKCPVCGNPVVIPKNRQRIECPSCRSHVNRKGKFGRFCDDCGHRHWSRESTLNCKAYTLWDKIKDDLPPWKPEGSREKPEWSRVAWVLIRNAIVERDGKRCTLCGNTPSDIRLSYYDGWCIDHQNHQSLTMEQRYILERETTLNVHHIIFRNDRGSDHPHNLRTLCYDCHSDIHFGKTEHKINSPVIPEQEVLIRN